MLRFGNTLFHHSILPLFHFFFSLPNSVRHGILFEVKPAAGTLVWGIPDFDRVQSRDRALKLETRPLETSGACVEETVKNGIEVRRKTWPPALEHKRRLAPVREQAAYAGFIGDPQSRHRVIKLPAIPAGDRLHKKVQATIGATRDLRPIPALGTLKPIGAPHVISPATIFVFSSSRPTHVELHKKGAPNRGAPNYTRL
jgi:hypothetical protein